jgi:hypothetical protein
VERVAVLEIRPMLTDSATELITVVFIFTVYGGEATSKIVIIKCIITS